MKVQVLFIFVQLIILVATDDLFSSIEDLERLSFNEKKNIKEIEKLILKLEDKTEKLKRKVEVYKYENNLMKEDPMKYIVNPLNAFLLIKRLSYDIFKIGNMLSDITQEFVDNSKGIRLEYSDFEGAVQGLARLQVMYSLNPEDLAQGIINGEKYREELTAEDLLALGGELMNIKNYLIALPYLKLAEEKNKITNELPELVLLEAMLYNYNQTKKNEEMVDIIDKILNLDPRRDDLKGQKQRLELIIKASEGKLKDPREQARNTGMTEFLIMRETCSGRVNRSAEVISKLHCRYDTKTPFLKLAPLKLEEANLDPFIAIYHDVMSDNEVDLFILNSRPTLSRASVFEKDASAKVADIRVAKLSWQHDNNDKVFKRLTERVGDMSGLNMKTSEAWQTQNYGIGGHYEAHYDFTTKDSAPFTGGLGNRIATALFYLSDVERGGSTVFPYLRIKVDPKKGSAVFWYNLSTSGELEYYTRHAACPVLVGSKWVANKWIHEYGQEWMRPCELKPALTDEEYYKKMKILKVFLIVASIISIVTSEDLFSSIEQLEILSRNEDQLLKDTDWLIKKLELLIEQIKINQLKARQEHEEMLRDSFTYILNPLNALLLIKRLSYNVIQTVNAIKSVADQFSRYTEDITLPYSDFEGAVQGLVRLQTIYSLNPEDLAKGIIDGKKYRDELSANDLLALGEVLTYRDFDLPSVSLNYLNLALTRNQETNEISDLVILEQLYSNYKSAGNTTELVKIIDKILEIAPEREYLELERIDLELSLIFGDKTKDIDEKESPPPPPPPPPAGFNKNKELKYIIAACTGTAKRTDKELSQVRCRYVSKSPFSKIAPFKVEEASLDPYIVVFYDVISNDEIEIFKSTAKEGLKRASVLNPDSTSRIDDVRVAKLHWQADTQGGVFERVSKRVGDMTGLNMKTAEIWQTQNYGIGGHYGAHYDFTTPDAAPFHLGTGNRIATTLFYLSDVEKGGATIFPYLRIKVDPRKGSALFWYNLSTSGDVEYYTRHAACPVLVGSKWVANKWIHEYEQEWTRPCELKPAPTDANYYKKNQEKAKEELTEMRRDSYDYILNPLNAILLIKRLSFDFLLTVELIKSIADQFAKNAENITLPYSEFEEAMRGLVRLQNIYKLNPEDLAKGIIDGKKYRDELSANDLLAFGEVMNHKEFDLPSISLDYLNLALTKNQMTKEVSDLVILEQLYSNYKSIGNTTELVRIINRILEIAPERDYLKLERINLELSLLLNDKPKDVVENTSPPPLPPGSFNEAKENELISAVCTGTAKRTDKELSQVHCRYVSKSPFSKIAPFKVEEASLDPYIVVFYDVISNDEIEIFKSTAKEGLKRASVLNPDSTSRIDDVRVAKLHWQADTQGGVFERVSKRVGDMTGLNMKTAEIWQTQNYGIGGHYGAHYDFTTPDAAPFHLGTGNRIATTLFYLSDVEKGGATIFPYLRIKVDPRKGSALFWYNLSTSGDVEYYTRHVACPVLVGSKWVANKWIHEYEQEWTRPNQEKAKEELTEMRRDSYDYILNPLNAILLIKRLSFDFLLTVELIKSIADQFAKNAENITLPYSEFEGAMRGLVRLQNIYKLNPEDLANGIIDGKKYRDELSANDLLAFGEVMNHKEFDLPSISLDYLNLALTKNQMTKEVSDLVILEQLYSNYKSIGNTTELVRIINRILEIAPERDYLKLERINLELSLLLNDKPKDVVENTSPPPLPPGSFNEAKENELISAVCTGTAKRTDKELSQVHCRYVSKSPFSKIAPFKVEEASLDPYIVMFYDVISDDEIEIFKSTAKERLEQASVFNADGSLRVDSISKFAVMARMDDSEHEVFKRLIKRHADMTGLNMKSAEKWKVQNYGLGGHHIPHYDFVKRGEVVPFDNGNRISTMLFYLSDVEKGGSTVFPYLRIKVDPRKGSSLFWFNMNTSGEEDYFTRHAACPVMIGSKWVATKMTQEHGHEFIRPCGLKHVKTDEKDLFVDF
ncbi:CLUMA_CG011615, isoform A [Clunio marinus]|uniref:procollagen-proline 4-dioxygenase n=1 Tax=Clunio marinus TaxID=568069 RepID=A0A1J1IDA5_9DIPT|nr:CLUMA_CG011615, isoform A [Clunio marinus]